MVKQYLRSVSEGETADERWLRELERLQAKVDEQMKRDGVTGPIVDLTREELHDREARRAEHKP